MQPRIIHREDAARYCGYDGANSAFDDFARSMGFKKVRGGCYDIKQIDAALDAAAGLHVKAEGSEVDNWFEKHGAGTS